MLEDMLMYLEPMRGDRWKTDGMFLSLSLHPAAA